jgi:alpha-glucosidase
VLAYIRSYADRRWLVVLNLGPQPQRLDARRVEIQGRIVLSTHLDRAGEVMCGIIPLRADEGVIVRLE